MSRTCFCSLSAFLMAFIIALSLPIQAEEPVQVPAPQVAAEVPAEPAAAVAVPEPVQAPAAEVAPAAAVATATTNVISLTKDELLNQLKTRQAQLALDQSESEMNRARVDHDENQRLFDDKIITIDQLNKTRQALEQAVLKHDQAMIELEKTRLEFLKGATLVTVVDAKKYRSPDGQIMVSVKLRNDSDVNKAWIAMGGAGQISRDQVTSLLRINNIIVSLRDLAIIGDPYQLIVPDLKLGQDVVLEYRLLKREVESVTVAIEFLETKTEYTVFLMKEALQDLPTVASTQYAQEGQLGSKIRYDLDLERLASTEQSFSLVVLNMPKEIPFAFIDPANNARVTHVKFSEQLSSQRLQLELAIPEKLDPKLVGSSVDFSVVVTRPSELAHITTIRQKHENAPIPAEEIAQIKGNRLALKLIPTGVGKLDILAANLFKEVKRGDEVSFKFSLINSGTLLLRSVTPNLNLPTEWEGASDPKVLQQLEPGDQTLVTVTLRPPTDVSVGEYIVKLAADGKSGVETIDATDKNFTIRLAAPTNVTGTVVLVIILIVLVLGIAAASIKISRR